MLRNIVMDLIERGITHSRDHLSLITGGQPDGVTPDQQSLLDHITNMESVLSQLRNGSVIDDIYHPPVEPEDGP